MQGFQGAYLTQRGRQHSAHVIEPADRPAEVTMAPRPRPCQTQFAQLTAVKANIVDAKLKVAFGIRRRPGDE